MESVDERTRAGDPFVARARRESEECPLCFGGWLTLTVEEDGEEQEIAVRCRRCNAEDDS